MDEDALGVVAQGLLDLRTRLEGLVDRALYLRGRLETQVPSIELLDRLAQHVHAPVGVGQSSDVWEGEGADFPSGGWEISLINEEGK